MHADWVQDVTAAEWRCFIRRHPPPNIWQCLCVFKRSRRPCIIHPTQWTTDRAPEIIVHNHRLHSIG